MQDDRNAPPATPRPGTPVTGPESLAGLCARAVALHQQGQLGAAERLFIEIVERDPRHADAIHHLGILAFQAGDFHDAVSIIRDSLAVNPRNAAAWSNLGLALERSGRAEQALVAYDRALALKPAYPEAHYNRGNALRELDRLEEALASYDAALAHRRDYLEAQVNRGRTLRDLGRLAEAVAAYDAALRLRPGFPPAELNQAFARLALGDFARGLPQFEARWHDGQLAGATRTFPVPLWDGREPLDGTTILVHAEQGLGDTLQFCRYVPVLAGRGARVVLEAQGPLVGLLRGLGGASAVVARGEPLPGADFHCPLLSLPLACGTTVDTIPREVPYLSAPAERVRHWESRLGPRRHSARGLRIGVAWSGNAAYRNDRQRSLPLAALGPLFGADADIVSLQDHLREEDKAAFRANADRIRSFAEDLTDFTETAALASCMDLVVTADTAAAHLAGALGRRAWIMLPFAADWRWLDGRTDSPWYPAARLFRQPRRGDWAAVAGAVRAALDAGAAGQGSGT
jgi:Flp pilus assembly protein TadD